LAPSRRLLQIACRPDASAKESKEKEIDGLHTSNRTFERLRHYDWKVMDLLFRALKKHLADKRVATDADVKRAVTKIATDTSHRFLLRGVKSSGATVG
jgi:hypothetical protein